MPRSAVVTLIIIAIGFPLAFVATQVFDAPTGTGLLIGLIVVGVVATIDRWLQSRPRG